MLKYYPGFQASAHFFCSGGARPASKFLGGGLFIPGSLLRLNFNPKNNYFSDDFPVIFWFIHIMLLY